MRRAASMAALRPIFVLISLYFGTIYGVFSGVFDGFFSPGIAVCGDAHAWLIKVGTSHARARHLAHEATGRLVVTTVDRFPFSLGSKANFRDEFTVRAVALRDGDPGLRVTPTVSGIPLQLGAGLAFGESLLFWGHYRERSDDPRQYAQVAVHADGTMDTALNRDRLQPLGIDAQTGTLVSFELRETILGGQPREEERPPQRLVFEPLDDRGLPRAEDAYYHPLRRLVAALPDRGAVYVLRRQMAAQSVAVSPKAYLRLEKYDLAARAVIWSYTIDDAPFDDPFAAQARLVSTPGGIGVEMRDSIPAGKPNESYAAIRRRVFDVETGARVEDDVRRGNFIEAEREVRLLGRTFVLTAHRGHRNNCLTLEAVDP